MIEITFREFFEYKYHEDGFHELYVMKNGLDETLYIGISSENIWNRWFGSRGHVMVGTNYLIGESSVGRKVVDHLPDSWDWKIQLWTLQDCIEFCKDILPPLRQYPIEFVESFMIQKLSPILNGSYNLHPGKDTTQKSKKEIEREKLFDEMYKKIFDKT